jgi:transcriptional regulator with XRE-family HTH domain
MSDDVRHLIGRNVKQLRVAAGITQTKLAERMGVDRAYVSGLELGQRNPTVVTLWHIAKALDVKFKSFYDEEKRRRSN